MRPEPESTSLEPSYTQYQEHAQHVAEPSTAQMTTIPTADRSRPRYVIPLIAAVATIALAAVAALAWTMSTVTVVADGVEHRTHIFGAANVDKALLAAGIDVSERDEVIPPVGSELGEDRIVTVNHSRLLELTVEGGESQEIWTTALTVGEAVDALGERYAQAELSASRSMPLGREKTTITANLPESVTVTVDGGDRDVMSLKGTVGEALADAGIELSDQDIVEPAADQPLVHEMVIKIVRVTTVETTETEEIDFKTTKKNSSSLKAGEEKVTTKGEKGEKTTTIKITRHDGKEVSREKLSSEVTKKPVDEVVEVGAAKPEAPPGSSGSSGGTADAGIWDKLAKCESGGNWSINTGNGYYGGLQFNLNTWRAYGGEGYPHENSKAEQIRIAEKVRAKQGWGAWPSCSRKLGLR